MYLWKYKYIWIIVSDFILYSTRSFGCLIGRKSLKDSGRETDPETG